MFSKSRARSQSEQMGIIILAAVLFLGTIIGVFVYLWDADAKRWDNFVEPKHMAAPISTEAQQRERVYPMAWAEVQAPDGFNVTCFGRTTSGIFGGAVMAEGNSMVVVCLSNDDRGE